MKKLIKTSSLILSAALLIFSLSQCSKNTDPANSDFFAGTYNGSISYNDGNSTISNNTTGKIFVTKIASGTKYNFGFSDNIPDLNGVEFNKEGDNILVSVGATSSVYIRIDNSVLRILYTKDGKTWTANCTR